MPKHVVVHEAAGPESPAAITREVYDAELRELQAALVHRQQRVIERGERVLILLEGRDAAGKDGSIKRLVEYLSPRETRVVALGPPSDRERGSWYFQRHVAHLPMAGEIVIFNRSWYNRAGVERVMHFCSRDECEAFLASVVPFETLLQHAGITLLKYYLDISKGDQRERLKDRRRDPLTAWKRSPVDAVAIKHWNDYSKARDAMLLRSHSEAVPWTIIHADNKLLARLNLMRDILARLAGKSGAGVSQPDPKIAFPFSPECLRDGRMAV